MVQYYTTLLRTVHQLKLLSHYFWNLPLNIFRRWLTTVNLESETTDKGVLYQGSAFGLSQPQGELRLGVLGIVGSLFVIMPGFIVGC